VEGYADGGAVCGGGCGGCCGDGLLDSWSGWMKDGWMEARKEGLWGSLVDVRSVVVEGDGCCCY